MTPAPCPECGETVGHLLTCRLPPVCAADAAAAANLVRECATLRARVAELEAQHDGNGDAFASGRRYERAWQKQRAPALDSLIAHLKQQLKATRLEAAVETNRLVDERDQLAVVVKHVRALALDFAEHASLLRSAYGYNDYDRGRTIALESAYKQLQALLPKEAP